MNPAAAAASARMIRDSMSSRGGRARSRSPPGDPSAASSSDPIYADPAPAFRGRRTLPATFGDRIPGNLVRFANGTGAFVLDKGGGKIGFKFLNAKVKPEHMDRIPLYDKKDEAAKKRYLAAARASKMS